MILIIKTNDVEKVVQDLHAQDLQIQWLDTNRLWSDNRVIIAEVKKYLKKSKVPFEAEKG